jgi:hypothetical protein
MRGLRLSDAAVNGSSGAIRMPVTPPRRAPPRATRLERLIAMRETTRCWAAQSRSTSSRHGPRPERIAAGAKAPSQNRLTSDRNFRNPIGPCSTATRASRRRLSRRICRPCPAAACACHRHRRSASMRSFSPLRSGRSLQDEEQQRMWRLPLLDETGSLRRAARPAAHCSLGRRPAVVTRGSAPSRRAIALAGAG